MFIFHRRKIDLNTKKDVEHYISKHLAPCGSGINFNLPIQDILEEQTETFSEYLIKLINDRNIQKYSEIYKPVSISRKVFNAVLNGQHPSRKTAISIAVGLKLTLKETQRLLETAGYILSCGSKEDLIIQYCIEKRKSPSEIDDIYNEFIGKSFFSLL